MNKEKYIIRQERKNERREVEELVRASFWNVYRPGAMEHCVLHKMRNYPDFISELNFVLEKDGRIVGQNVFVRAEVKADDGRIIPIAAMGPICIAPELKRQGYGKLLLDYTLEKAGEYGIKAVCFEGNIDFYGHSGFVRASEFGLRYHGMPEGVEADFFLAKELTSGYLDGVSGEYEPPEVYMVSEEEVEVFDRDFPPMKKLRLPGQLW